MDPRTSAITRRRKREEIKLIPSSIHQQRKPYKQLEGKDTYPDMGARGLLGNNANQKLMKLPL